MRPAPPAGGSCLALALCATLCWLAAAPPAAAQKPRAERPTYEQGEQWVLNDGVYDLIRVDKDVYVFAAGPQRQIQLSRDLAVVRVIKDGRIEWQLDPSPKLTWPMEVGKWGVTYDTVLHNRDHPTGVRVRLTWEVKAYESVRVPAGTFQAFRVEYLAEVGATGDMLRRSAALPGRQFWTLVTWYAPDARRIVKAEAGDLKAVDFQVVSLDRAGTQAPLEVLLDEPKDQAHVSTDRVTLGGKVTAGAGVARLSITLNGAEVGGPDLILSSPRPEVTLSRPLTLREGKNVLLVTATDVRGGSRQEARVVFRDPAAAPPVAAPPVPAAPAAPPPATAMPSLPAAPPPAAAVPSLRIVISSPQDQARVNQDTVGLAAVVSSGKGVTRVLITLNGVEIARQEERAAPRTLPVNLPVKLRDGQNTLVVTATDPDGLAQQEIRSVTFDRVVPLTVEVRHPEDRARVDDETSLVAAEVTSSRGVASVTVILNGREVFKQPGRMPQRSVAVAAPIKLREGSNTVVVRATEPDGTVRQEVRTVIYERPPATAPTPPKPATARERWAVVIGAGHYSNPAIPSLRYTVADAESFYEMLVGQAGFKKDNVLLLTDKTERKPFLRDIKWALGTFLARSARKEDIVIIYFAGHGAPEVDPRGAESDGLAKYLVPTDADPNDLYSTALPMDEFQVIFDRIEADQLVVFLDSCYSGAAGGRTFASKRTRAVRVDDIFLDRLTRSKGRAIVTASRTSEVSVELPELGHGLFTYYLVQGLRGAADLDRDGIVSLQEVYQYLEQQVTQKSRAVGGNQHPVMKGELEGILPLVKVGGR